MNRLSHTKQSQVTAPLVKGNCIRSTERMTVIAKHTTLELIRTVRIAFADYQDRSSAMS